MAPPGVYFGNEMSASLWIRVNKISTWSRVFDFGLGKGLSEVCLIISCGTSLHPALFNGGQFVTSSKALVLGLWSHIVATIENDEGKIYFNGELTGVGSFIIDKNVVRTANYIGRSLWPDDENAYADMFDLKIFYRALKPNEVIDVMNGI